MTNSPSDGRPPRRNRDRSCARSKPTARPRRTTAAARRRRRPRSATRRAPAVGRGDRGRRTARKTAREAAAKPARPARKPAAKARLPGGGDAPRVRQAGDAPARGRAAVRAASPPSPRPSSAALAAAAAAPDVRPARLQSRHWLMRPVLRAGRAAALRGDGRAISTPAPPTSITPRSPSRCAPRNRRQRRRRPARRAHQDRRRARPPTPTSSSTTSAARRSSRRSTPNSTCARSTTARRGRLRLHASARTPSIEAAARPLAAAWSRSTSNPAPASSTSAPTPSPPRTRSAIAEAILAECSALVNQLSDQARDDAVHFAQRGARRGRGEPARRARSGLADFRRENRSSTPRADVAGQIGPAQRAAGRARQGDGRARHAPDLRQPGRPAGGPGRPAHRRDRQSASRPSAARSASPGPRARCPTWSAPTRSCGSTSSSPTPPTPSRSRGLAAARAEARRQSRYLAPHVQPTLAEESLYPRRALLSGLAAAVPAARLGHR